MNIKDIIGKMTEEKRQEVEKTIDACMESICCDTVNWREFTVYESSVDIMLHILENLAVEFLLPIAEAAREESGRELIIFANKVNRKDDEVWFVHVKSKQIHATINISTPTAEFLERGKK